jgi:hypothetical protein
MRFKYLALPGYFIAILMIVVPVVETALGVLPLRMSEVSWRFGAVGLMSRAALTPVIALFGALVLATVLEQRRAQRIIGFIAAILGVLLLGIVLLFTIDGIQMSGVVRPEGKKALIFATTEALVKFSLFTIALFVLARAALKSTSARVSTQKSKKDVIVVNRMPAT